MDLMTFMKSMDKRPFFGNERASAEEISLFLVRLQGQGSEVSMCSHITSDFCKPITIGFQVKHQILPRSVNRFLRYGDGLCTCARTVLGCIVKEAFLWDQRELMKLCGTDTWKYKIWQHFLEKNAFPIGTRGQKRSNFPKMSYISRSSPVVQKLEQLEHRKKHLKAHSTGYRRLHIGFDLKSVFKFLEDQRFMGK